MQNEDFLSADYNLKTIQQVEQKNYYWIYFKEKLFESILEETICIPIIKKINNSGIKYNKRKPYYTVKKRVLCIIYIYIQSNKSLKMLVKVTKFIQLIKISSFD